MSVIDFIMVRRSMLNTIRNSKVLCGDAIATQHRILIVDFSGKMEKNLTG